MSAPNALNSLRFQSLQVGRGLAALAVLLYHAADTLMLPKYLGEDTSGVLKHFLPGHAGVHYFFILSGFVIYYVHSADTGVSEFATFFRKRLTRLLPALWVWLTVVTALLAIQPSAAGELFGLKSIIEAFLLVPVEQEVVLKVEWTLRHEMLFYVAFSIYVLNRSVGFWLLTAWFTASFFATLIQLPYPHSFIFSPLHLLFLFGIAIAHFSRRVRLPFPLFLSAIGAAIVGTAWVFDPGHFVQGSNSQLFGFGIGSALLISGLIELERQDRLANSRVLNFLGDASYSIYLTNLTVISALCKVATIINAKIFLPMPLWLLIIASVATAFGCIFFYFVERPLIALISANSRNFERTQVIDSSVK